MRRVNTFVVSLIAACLTAAICYAGTLVDQGAPGRQGPWPVYLLPVSNSLLAKSNTSFSLTPGMLTSHAVFTSTQTVSTAIVGQACAVGVPAGFDTINLVTTCVTGTGTVEFFVYNTTSSSVLGTSGTYTAVVF